MSGKGMMLHDARRLSGHALEDLRRRVVSAVGSGASQSEVARLFGVSRATVNRWMQAYRLSGEESFHPRKRGRREGEKFSLSARQQEEITRCISENYPDAVDLPQLLWTRQAVAELVNRMFGLRLSMSSVSNYLRRWGFSVAQPLPHARARSPIAVRVWTSSKYELIAEQAAVDGALIYWLTWLTLRYKLSASGPRRKPDGREIGADGLELLEVTVLLAMSNKGSLYFAAQPGACGPDRFVEFLDRLSSQIPRKLCVVVDLLDVSVDEVTGWLDANADRMTVHFPFLPTGNNPGH